MENIWNMRQGWIVGGRGGGLRVGLGVDRRT